MISLAEKSPNLIHEWSERNHPLSPETVSYGSHRMVWWKGNCGHEWQAVVKSRSIGRQTGCPYCSGNRVLKGFNDFATRYPEIASEWSEKNAPFSRDQFSAFSNRKMWWKGIIAKILILPMLFGYIKSLVVSPISKLEQI